jgi:hypothetical protein
MIWDEMNVKFVKLAKGTTRPLAGTNEWNHRPPNLTKGRERMRL